MGKIPRIIGLSLVFLAIIISNQLSYVNNLSQEMLAPQGCLSLEDSYQRCEFLSEQVSKSAKLFHAQVSELFLEISKRVENPELVEVYKKARHRDPGVFIHNCTQEEIQQLLFIAHTGIKEMLAWEKDYSSIIEPLITKKDYEAQYKLAKMRTSCYMNFAYLLWMTIQLDEDKESLIHNSNIEKHLERCYYELMQCLTGWLIDESNLLEWIHAMCTVLHAQVNLYSYMFQFYGNDERLIYSINTLAMRYYQIVDFAEKENCKIPFEDEFSTIILALTKYADPNIVLHNIALIKAGNAFHFFSPTFSSCFTQIALFFKDLNPMERILVFNQDANAVREYFATTFEQAKQVALENSVSQEAREKVQLLFAFKKKTIDFAQQYFNDVIKYNKCEDQSRQLIFSFYQLFHLYIYQNNQDITDKIRQCVDEIKRMLKKSTHLGREVRLTMNYFLHVYYLWEKDTDLARKYLDTIANDGKGAGSFLGFLQNTCSFFQDKAKEQVKVSMIKLKPQNEQERKEIEIFKRLITGHTAKGMYDYPSHFKPLVWEIISNEKEKYIEHGKNFFARDFMERYTSKFAKKYRPKSTYFGNGREDPSPDGVFKDMLKIFEGNPCFCYIFINRLVEDFDVQYEQNNAREFLPCLQLLVCFATELNRKENFSNISSWFGDAVFYMFSKMDIDKKEIFTDPYLMGTFMVAVLQESTGSDIYNGRLKQAEQKAVFLTRYLVGLYNSNSIKHNTSILILLEDYLFKIRLAIIHLSMMKGFSDSPLTGYTQKEFFTCLESELNNFVIPDLNKITTQAVSMSREFERIKNGQRAARSGLERLQYIRYYLSMFDDIVPRIREDKLTVFNTPIRRTETFYNMILPFLMSYMRHVITMYSQNIDSSKCRYYMEKMYDFFSYEKGLMYLGKNKRVCTAMIELIDYSLFDEDSFSRGKYHDRDSLFKECEAAIQSLVSNPKNFSKVYSEKNFEYQVGSNIRRIILYLYCLIQYRDKTCERPQTYEIDLNEGLRILFESYQHNDTQKKDSIYPGWILRFIDDTFLSIGTETKWNIYEPDIQRKQETEVNQSVQNYVIRQKHFYYRLLALAFDYTTDMQTAYSMFEFILSNTHDFFQTDVNDFTQEIKERLYSDFELFARGELDDSAFIEKLQNFFFLMSKHQFRISEEMQEKLYDLYCDLSEDYRYPQMRRNLIELFGVRERIQKDLYAEFDLKFEQCTSAKEIEQVFQSFQSETEKCESTRASILSSYQKDRITPLLKEYESLKAFLEQHDLDKVCEVISKLDKTYSHFVLFNSITTLVKRANESEQLVVIGDFENAIAKLKVALEQEPIFARSFYKELIKKYERAQHSYQQCKEKMHILQTQYAENSPMFLFSFTFKETLDVLNTYQKKYAFDSQIRGFYEELLQQQELIEEECQSVKDGLKELGMIEDYKENQNMYALKFSKLLASCTELFTLSCSHKTTHRFLNQLVDYCRSKEQVQKFLDSIEELELFIQDNDYELLHLLYSMKLKAFDYLRRNNHYEEALAFTTQALSGATPLKNIGYYLQGKQVDLLRKIRKLGKSTHQESEKIAMVKEYFMLQLGAFFIITNAEYQLARIRSLYEMTNVQAIHDLFKQTHWHKYSRGNFKAEDVRGAEAITFYTLEITDDVSLPLVISTFPLLKSEGILQQFVVGENYRVLSKKNGDAFECPLEIVKVENDKVYCTFPKNFVNSEYPLERYITLLKEQDYISGGRMQRIPNLPIHDQVAFFKEVIENLSASISTDYKYGKLLETIPTAGNALLDYALGLQHYAPAPGIQKILKRGKLQFPNLVRNKNILKDRDQEKAVFLSVLGTQNVVLVWGPPGGGKSTVIVESAMQITDARLAGGYHVLLTAPTQRAVDVLVAKLIEAGAKNIIRVGCEERKIASTGSSYSAEIMENWNNREKIAKILLEANEKIIVLGTATGFRNDPVWRNVIRPRIKEFGRIIADEQSMSSLLETGTLLKELSEDGTLILAGDQVQLCVHPISQDEVTRMKRDLVEANLFSAEEIDRIFSPEHLLLFQESLFSHLIKRDDLMSSKLRTLRRFPPTITEFLNFVFESEYFGDLQGREKNPMHQDEKLIEQIEVVDYEAPHKQAERLRNGVTGQYVNYTEIELSLQSIDEHLERGADPKRITCIAPYKAHLEELSKAVLSKALVNDIYYEKIDRKKVLVNNDLLEILMYGLKDTYCKDDITRLLLNNKKNAKDTADELRTYMRWDIKSYTNKNIAMTLDNYLHLQVAKLFLEETLDENEDTYSFKEKNPYSFRLSTVHTIQGGENEYVIVNMVRSNREGKKGFYSAKGGPNMVVVMLSRAMKKLTIIADCATMSMRNSFLQQSDDIVKQSQYSANLKIVDFFERIKMWTMHKTYIERDPRVMYQRLKTRNHYSHTFSEESLQYEIIYYRDMINNLRTAA